MPPDVTGKKPDILIVCDLASVLRTHYEWNSLTTVFEVVESIDAARERIETEEFNIVVVEGLGDKIRSFSMFLKQRGIPLVMISEDVSVEAFGRKLEIFDDIMVPLPQRWFLEYKFRCFARRKRDMERVKALVDVQKKQINATSSNAMMLDQISQMAREFNTFDLNSIYNLCVEKIGSLFNAGSVSLYLYHKEEKELVLKQSNSGQAVRRVMVEADAKELMSMVCESGEPIIISDINKYKLGQSNGNAEVYPEDYVNKSCIVAPIRSNEGLEGVLNLCDKGDDSVYTEINDKGAIEVLLRVVGGNILNCRLYNETRKQARHDGLTGLLNHRVFKEELTREVARSSRYGLDLSLIMCDIDHFKKFNDDFGHQAGDFVLKEISHLYADLLRADIDICARYGGEEFVFMLPETPLNGAAIVAERIRQRVEKHSFIYSESQQFSVTISLGVAELTSGQITSDFIESADSNLYIAKEKGRNQVQFSE